MKVKDTAGLALRLFIAMGFSEILMVIHQDAEGMYELGIIDNAKMGEFDEIYLVPEPEPAEEVRQSGYELLSCQRR
jgi:hypothetical protein